MQVWLIAPVRTSSASTRTPTSIEVRQAALTVARRVTTSPTWMGERKRISSTAAVTTRPPARRVAAIAATSSHSFMIQPPWTLPAMFASCTPMRYVSTDTVSAGWRSTVMRAHPSTGNSDRVGRLSVHR